MQLSTGRESSSSLRNARCLASRKGALVPRTIALKRGHSVRLYALPDRVYWESGTMVETLYTWEKERWGWPGVQAAASLGYA